MSGVFGIEKGNFNGRVVVVKFKKQWYTAIAGVLCIVHTSVVNTTDTPGPGESEE